MTATGLWRAFETRRTADRALEAHTRDAHPRVSRYRFVLLPNGVRRVEMYVVQETCAACAELSRRALAAADALDEVREGVEEHVPLSELRRARRALRIAAAARRAEMRANPLGGLHRRVSRVEREEAWC